jgi:competence protein ComEC
MTALAVGDGTAIVVRSGRSAILFDAGSSSIPALGERVVVPALHELGIRRLDAIVISHANLDHVSGIPDVLDAVRVERVIVSSHMLVRANGNLDGMANSVIDAARSRGVRIETANRGDELEFGELRMSVRHPRAGEACKSVNDESIVAIVSAIKRHTRILLCGDAQDEALARLMQRDQNMSAEIMELPHHGSWRATAREFLARIGPEQVVQSTGPGRYALDRWQEAMRGRIRWVTARDGAASIPLE